MGTPEFAVEPLRTIIAAGYNVLGVITAPDKPAGRGQRLLFSPVKEFALNNNLKVLQPTNLKSPEFIDELKSLGANIQVVVAFRMLPEVIWQMPEYGTLNLHASLLPQYRGAAPINHAIINGETETGVTTFFIAKEIDTGNIILTKKLPILPSDDAGILHDRLMLSGSELLLDTLKMIESEQLTTTVQDDIIDTATTLHTAPKIFKQDCIINWSNSCLEIHNLIRGLSPIPGAFSNMVLENKSAIQVKLYKTSFVVQKCSEAVGGIITDNKNTFSVVAKDGLINIEELQLEGKRRMKIAEFLRGKTIGDKSHFES
jgi:methionyl-tRNA formyltransferase